MGDLHAGRDAGRTGGVLQVGDGVAFDVDRFPGGADLVGHRVDGDDARTLLGGPAAEELPHALGGLGGGQDRRRVAVVEHGVQAADVAGLGRVEQRYRDAAGIQRAEERDEVFEVLRAQDRNPVTGLGDLLQAGADGPVALAEHRPVQIPLDAVALGGEVEEPVGDLVPTHLGPSFDVPDQAAVVGKPDQSVLDERVVEGHLTLLSNHTLATRDLAHVGSPRPSHTRSSARTQTRRSLPGSGAPIGTRPHALEPMPVVTSS